MSSLSHSLRNTNRRLGSWLDSMIPGPGQSIIITPEHMAGLLSELLRAGAVLRARPLPAKGDDPELDRELERYRNHVERLRELLPSLHRNLLMERARLEARRSAVPLAINKNAGVSP